MRKTLLIKPARLSSTWFCWLTALASALLGVGWLLLFWPASQQPIERQLLTTETPFLRGPLVAAMDSNAFTYNPGWQISPRGADPVEPADPWQEPAGVLSFAYQGSELALALAVGNYWGYLYVTVDGQPANGLPLIRGNNNSQNQPAGYRTFYVPTAQGIDGPSTQWIMVHRASDPTALHDVRIEVWRSWGQQPLRGVAVDAGPPTAMPLWPGTLLVLIALGSTLLILSRAMLPRLEQPATGRRWLASLHRLGQRLLFPNWAQATAPVMAVLGGLLIAIAIWLELWPVTWIGLALLAWAGLQRPALWVSTLLFALPFYFRHHLPLLPNRALGIVDVGVLVGLGLVSLHWLFTKRPTAKASPPPRTSRERWPQRTAPMTMLLLLLAGWALITTAEAAQVAVALREWRTIFLTALLFAATLHLLFQASSNSSSSRLLADQQLMLAGWLLGGTVVAAVALWQYASGTWLIQAEGVQRVRGFYGSPNNLALYLERTVACTLALALFPHHEKRQWLWLCAAIVQAAALLLTFSKGALLLALPASFGLLFVGGFLLLRRRGSSLRALWWLAGLGLLMVGALLPFLAAERFQQLFNFEGGTGFIRLQLWRSSWAMALDHPWLGLGPDNFLYAYRSHYMLPAAWQEPNLNHPHNWPLDWWTRLGLPGLIFALCWFGLILWRQWRALWQRETGVVALGLLATTVGALAHGLIDASYALPDLMLIWVMVSYLPVAANRP